MRRMGAWGPRPPSLPLPRVWRFRRSLVRGLPGVPRPRAALPSEGVFGFGQEKSPPADGKRAGWAL